MANNKEKILPFKELDLLEAEILKDRKEVDEDNEFEIRVSSAFETYMKGVSQYQILTREQEEEYGRKLKGTPKERKEAKDRLVLHNLRYVIKMARRYVNEVYSLEDAIQDGNIGLMKAADKFDPNLGFRFTTYATWWIRQSIIRAFMNTGRTIRIPVHIYEKISKLKRIEKDLEDKGLTLSEEEIAERMGITEYELSILRIHEIGVASLDAPLKSDEDGESSLLDFVKADDQHNPEQIALDKDMKDNVLQAILELDETSADVLMSRFGINRKKMTLEEIAHNKKVTPERIRQIEKTALRKLKYSKAGRKLRKYVLGNNGRPMMFLNEPVPDGAQEEKEIIV